MAENPLVYHWTPPPGVAPALACAYVGFISTGRRSGRLGHPEWVLDYNREGTLRTRAGDARAPWRERTRRTGHLYPPETPYWEDTRGVPGPLRSAYVLFTGGEAAGLGALTEDAPYARLDDPEGHIEARLAAMAQIGVRRGEAGFWEAQAELAGLIDLLLRSKHVRDEDWRVASPTAGEERSDFVAAVQACLRAHLHERLTLDRIAAQLHVSPSSLSHRYRREAGISPVAAHLAMRLDVARALLLRGERLDAIAEQTGFHDAFHLSKAFKKRFGRAPRDFLRAARQR